MEKCSCCGCNSGVHPIVRRISLTDAQGILLDSAGFCAACWNGYRRDIEATAMVSGGEVA